MHTHIYKDNTHTMHHILGKCIMMLTFIYFIFGGAISSSSQVTPSGTVWNMHWH